MSSARILIVLTSHEDLGDTGEKTGFWLEEFASPYYVFLDAGADVTLASTVGGHPPVDPKSEEAEWRTDDTIRFDADMTAKSALASTIRVEDVDAAAYDAVFAPGGHGPMWDFPGNQPLARLIEAFDREKKPIGAVCHGPVALTSATKADGSPLVADRRVTGFTNGEEDAVGLCDVVPFLLENRLRDLGGRIDNGPDFAVNVITDGNLVTGQNPQSSAEGARAVLELLSAADG